MKKIKLISTITSLSVLGSLPLAITSCGNGKTETEVHISTLCDVHGEIPGYGDDFFDSNVKYAGAIRTVQEIQKIQANYPGSVTLLCGDQNGSGTFSTCAKGDTMYPVLSAMNAPYSAVGNHAWDFGKEKLEDKTFDTLGRTKDTKGNYFVTSNVLNDATLQTKRTWVYKYDQPGFLEDYRLWKRKKVSWADSYKVIDMAGHKVALLGLTTKQTLQDGAKAEIKDLAFIDYAPAIYYTKYQMVEDLGQKEFDKIDAFVALTHVQASINDEGEVYGDGADICKNIDTNIDLFLSGHWHSNVAAKVHNSILNKDIPIMQSAAHLESFCDATIKFDDTKPEGQRLKSIEPKIVKPDIEQDRAKAYAQIQDIINNPFNDIVKNTCDVYKQQKDIAISKLNKVLGTSTDGLKYDIFDHWDHKYGATGVEQTGVLVTKSNPIGLTLLHQDDINNGTIAKPSIGIISNDSIRASIKPGNVTLKDVYGIYAFDNKPIYFSLTYYQLEQVIEYMLENNYRDSNDFYTKDLYYEPGIKVPYSDIGDINLTYCPGQYGGFAFSVNKHTSENGKIYYTYIDDSLKVYDPYDGDIDDVDTYKGASFWTGNRKYIQGVMSNFSFNDGNKQYKMIKRFALYNDKQADILDKYKIHYYDDDVRKLVEATIVDMTNNGKTIDVPVTTLNKMFNGF